MKKILGHLLMVSLLTYSCKSTSQTTNQESKVDEVETKTIERKPFKTKSGITVDLVNLSPSDWKAKLTNNEYYVLREKGTERPFTGDLLNNKAEGIYTCAACGMPLFHSDTKYKSGTGWPSYFQPIEKAFILEDTDYLLGYARTEVMCMRCEGHLGHVFSDGPEPTGLRYCINAVSLDFVDDKSSDEIINAILEIPE